MQKTEDNLRLSDEAIELVAKRFKVLSEPTRLKLLMALDEGERNVSELVELTGEGQANVSRQLNSLTEAGILVRRKEKLRVFYKIADRSIISLCRHVCGSLRRHHQDRAEAFQNA
ncbi:MAG: metalloregulator ArsR/SmtB family transcription factor [Verrucomicrobia bacterium]|nr:metalloregulator ArsR/SmtB family transcription factor [Verrucomicrobiota bacterium]